MEFPEGLKYSKEHEWVLVEGNTATIGITEYAQEELGDIVYVELPELGEKVVKDDPFGAVESVKAVSDVYAPVGGTVLEVIDELYRHIPETLRKRAKIDLPNGLTEVQVRRRLAALASRNKTASDWCFFLGGGIYHHFIPSAVDAGISRPE